VFSPLDEELALVAGSGSPTLLAGLVRLGTALPFAQAAEALAFFWQVQVSTSTATRQTKAAGAAWEALQTAAVALLEQDPATPEPAPGPAVQQLSVDGAMVPLVGGTWAEVKTLAIGIVSEHAPDPATAAAAPKTSDWSYFSRMTDAATFTRLALVEVHARGVATAGTVCAVADGAGWNQGFADYHRPDAVRVLDCPHAVEHLTTAVQATFGHESPRGQAWLDDLRADLRYGAPADALETLCWLPVCQALDPQAAAAARDATLQYLASRWAQIQYADFVARGYPIGSGSVESANKLVVEVRLKGSGMRWAPASVNPLLALRTVQCSARWASAWPAIMGQRRAKCRRRRQRPAPPAATSPGSAPADRPTCMTAASPAGVPTPPAPPPPAAPPRMVQGRPTAAHPWKRPLLRGGREHNARAKL
jgi:hypothetical protein